MSDSRSWQTTLKRAAARGLPLRRSATLFCNVVLPPVCLLCGQAGGHAPLCPACIDELPALPSPHCPICLEATTHGERCGACLAHPPKFERLISLYSYAFPLDRLVLALKYQARFALAGLWGKTLAQRLRGVAAEAVVPVPLHPSRLAERGYNQAELIARPLARDLGLPLLAETLIKCRATPPQSASDLKHRRQNLAHAFALTGDVNGLSLLLVDDVLTTGATLNEIAALLLRHGATRVTAVTVARTASGTRDRNR